MASEVDICNLALSHLGDPATIASIDPPEGSPQARYCARYYPIARDLAQEAHAWAFNTRRAVLASVPLPATVEGEWLYAYVLPANCVRALRVYTPGHTEQGQSDDFTIEASDDGGQRVVYTNTPGACVQYLVRVADTTRYPPSFVSALSYLIARYVAGPLTKDMGRIQAMDGLYRLALASASALDSNAQSSEQWKQERAPGWIDAR